MTRLASDVDVESLAFEAGVGAVYAVPEVSREVELMRAAIAGDPAAMRSIYEREAPRLLRRLGHLCGDPALAQDLLQECFLRAFAGEVSFSGTSTAAPWLHGVALNLWRNELRKRERRGGLLRRQGEALEPRALAAPGERREHDELALRLREALATLDPKLREAFVLRVLEELPLAQASVLAGVSMATLSRRTKRAEAKLRSHFEDSNRRANEKLRAP
ncbi:RNA polymerase sigma-54 factor RpoN [Enhygromyxa salina]|uniref:RNA polymerase sigma-54 factor RpoN n=1 Tax=Enhygromyxa salina TaxID=215803 RepID=A0A0C1ZTS7_9BACT|nr:RNA polymerase sigma factor [Enhygromyxa salina]KIG14458.1 RNA polymerase sigma-54 factor RpoN [Enhygromyxa salina]